MKFLSTLIVIALFCCTGQKEVVNSYEYFKVDSVRSSGLYEILIRDPKPCIESQAVMYPTGTTVAPDTYDHYIKIIYKSDSLWQKGDTLILIKK